MKTTPISHQLHCNGFRRRFCERNLQVNVDDDTPIATNDTDTVDLQTNIATGNVITGVGTTSSGPDSAGADGGGHVTGLSSNNVAGHVDNDPAGGGFVVQGQFGTLTMQADGSYSYTENQNAPGGSSDVFTYSFTDATATRSRRR